MARRATRWRTTSRFMPAAWRHQQHDPFRSSRRRASSACVRTSTPTIPTCPRASATPSAHATWPTTSRPRSGTDAATVAAAQFYLADAARNNAANCGLQTGSVGFVAPTVTAAGVVTNPGSAGNSLLLPAVYRRSVELGPRISDLSRPICTMTRAPVSAIDITSNDQPRRERAPMAVQRADADPVGLHPQLAACIQALHRDRRQPPAPTTSGGCVPLNLFGPAGSIYARAGRASSPGAEHHPHQHRAEAGKVRCSRAIFGYTDAVSPPSR